MKDSISIRSIILSKLPKMSAGMMEDNTEYMAEGADEATQQIIQLLESKAADLIASDYTTSKNKNGTKVRLDLSNREPFIVRAIPLSAINELRSK